ncbi:uncharacterized protein LOC106181925 [Lingula anatina]|uniref:Uncharacterized protein LOC106181925 n=1 Tax=Lingula anatina TaxID=7574 RepID=A0A1S3KI81_LINAN|nr:uncharacterized protein LOC106181925 [Lingula anatina]XP_013421927.1 uncharacterized protein LOC106181925 [Lingula anatina]XP_013421928.1 uncharacterized protein LOC106181925 [Lingula anatina]XP_013421929.1 uncharacterized protein LOC106181925 [Lingula anatina]|eukprot:XP_013421926.1 uncharacterized protein LOC106181925 [Lingula anatina]
MRRRWCSVVTTYLVVFVGFNLLILWSVTSPYNPEVQMRRMRKLSLISDTELVRESPNQLSVQSPSTPPRDGARIQDKAISTKKTITTTELFKADIQNMNFTLVTGSDNVYFDGLVNLVGSVHYWESRRNIVVYNLGLSETQIQRVKSWCRTKLVNFHLDSPRYPEHVSYLKKFAWKSVVLKDAVDRFGKILWIDAGCDVRGPMSKIDDFLKQDGHFFVQGQDVDMTRLTHFNMFRYFNETMSKFKGKYSFAGGISGWVKGSKAYRRILPRWIQCSMDVTCISPLGAGLANHRYDQSALSVIAYTSGVNITAHTELLAATRSQLHPDAKKPSPQVIYTARRGSSDYAAYVCERDGAS